MPGPLVAKISGCVKLGPITHQNAKASPLLRLPRAITHKVYAYVLGGRNFTLETNDETYEVHARPKLPQAFSLLQVCRQIYHEAVHLPFQLNTFSAFSILELNSAFRILARFRTNSILAAVTSIHISHVLEHEPEFWRYHYCNDHGFWALSFSETRSLLMVYPALKQAHFDIIPNHGPDDWLVWGPKHSMEILKQRIDVLFVNLKSRNNGVNVAISLHIYRHPGKVWRTWR